MEASEIKVTAAVVKIVVACSVPSTRLKMNDSGGETFIDSNVEIDAQPMHHLTEFIAVGASDGAVILFRSKNLAKVLEKLSSG